MSDETTTYRYVSLMEASVEIADWEMEEGEKGVFAGKKPGVWMPNVPDEKGENIIGVRLERKALAELPEWMQATNAFKWVHENEPEGFGEYYQNLKEEAQADA